MKNILQNILYTNLIILMCFFLVPYYSYSQGISQISLYSADDINVETIPNIPGPNESVQLKINSFSFNLNNYYVAWFKDGRQVLAGFGERNFRFIMGDTGTVTEIMIVVEYENQVFRKELRFAPSEVDLLWEAPESYTPPFYRGKALPLGQARIKITAIPETLLIEPNDAPNLIYYWDKNFLRQVAGSGFGKQSFSFNADPLFENEKITVTTNDRRENSFASSTLDIPISTHTAKILFYEINENDRLMTNRALNTNSIVTGNKMKMSFHPLNISSNENNFTDLFVDWRINNLSRPPQDFAKQNELYITSGDESGAVNVGINLEVIEKILQKGTGGIELFFTEETN
jgi:hypothetical protein